MRNHTAPNPVTVTTANHPGHASSVTLLDTTTGESVCLAFAWWESDRVEKLARLLATLGSAGQQAVYQHQKRPVQTPQTKRQQCKQAPRKVKAIA